MCQHTAECPVTHHDLGTECNFRAPSEPFPQKGSRLTRSDVCPLIVFVSIVGAVFAFLWFALP